MRYILQPRARAGLLRVGNLGYHWGMISPRVEASPSDRKFRNASASTALVVLLFASPASPGLLAAESHSFPRLKVSDNKHFLVSEDGRPFFYLGDTAWELFHRLNRQEADRYLSNRAAKGFTVIQGTSARSGKSCGSRTSPGRYA